MTLEQLHLDPGRRASYEVDVLDIDDRRAERDVASEVEMQNQFLVDMSHEIRSSLDTIMKVSDILRHEKLPARQKEEAQLIYESCDSLMLLMKNVVESVKIQAEKVDMGIVEHCLNPLLAEIDSVMSSSVVTKEGHEEDKGEGSEKPAEFYSFSQIDI